jgi:hypothetical protein
MTTARTAHMNYNVSKNQGGLNLNIFCQDKRIRNIKNLVGIYMQDEIPTKKQYENTTITRLSRDTTQGDFDIEYLKWNFYLVHCKDMDEHYIIIVKSDTFKGA